MKPESPDRPLLDALLAVVGLLLASVSVALYYNITFFGQAVVALPSVPVAGGCLLYYLSAFNSTPPVAQVKLWMASFLLAGGLWWVGLSTVARRFKTPLSPKVQRRLRLLPWLYLPPLPWLLWVHAQSPSGLSLQALKAAILVRDGLYWSTQGSEAILNALFLTLASTETVATLLILRQERTWGGGLLLGALAGPVTLVVLCALAQVAVQLH